MRQFHPATFCLIIATVGIVLSGCSVETTRPETVIPEWIIGATMEEVIEMEGEPAGRTPDQLVYRLFTSEKVTPYWAYILVLGVAGGMPDLDYVEHDFYCLTLNFENNILVSHSTTDREKSDSC